MMAAMTLFASTIELFDRYYRLMDQGNEPSFNRDLANEVRERLQQFEYIVGRVRTLESVHQSTLRRSQDALKKHIADLKSNGLNFEDVQMSSEAQITPEEYRVLSQAEFEIHLLTEAFYYFAGRVRTVLRNNKSPLPRLKSFECEGVRNTRNKLLEHAEGSDSEVFPRSLSFGGPVGPIIKGVRYADKVDVFPDAGLHVNAREFRDKLERLLADACSGGA